MHCVQCGHSESMVTNTWRQDKGGEEIVRRRRVCVQCGKAWFTRERYEVTLSDA